MNLHWSRALPLCSTIIYVVGALFLKRAAGLGAEVWRTTRICNFTTALVFTPLLLLGGTIPSSHAYWQPAAVGLCFVGGQVFTLQALNIGDVSVATPVLGIKVLLVALLTTLLTGAGLSVELWTAAALSSAAIGLLNFSGRHPHHRVGATIFLAALAASCFALVDVLVQKWSGAWGMGRFLPIMIAVAALVSLGLRPFRGGPAIPAYSPAPNPWPWIAAGAFCLALQALMIVATIALYREATLANVLYSSRGLWSVLVVWWIGRRFGHREGQFGRRVLLSRLAGAVLLMAAILIVLLRRNPSSGG